MSEFNFSSFILFVVYILFLFSYFTKILKCSEFEFWLVVFLFVGVTAICEEIRNCD